jgi:hypothetical protein
VVSKSPEKELAEFLSTKPPWLESTFWPAGSREELAAWSGSEYWNLEVWGRAKDQYESILRQIPARWREYCKEHKRSALKILGPSSGKRGRPRKDAEAKVLKKLHQTKSYEQIAIASLKGSSEFREATKEQQELLILKERERIRKLLGSRKTERHPDKIR